MRTTGQWLPRPCVEVETHDTDCQQLCFTRHSADLPRPTLPTQVAGNLPRADRVGVLVLGSPEWD